MLSEDQVAPGAGAELRRGRYTEGMMRQQLARVRAVGVIAAVAVGLAIVLPLLSGSAPAPARAASTVRWAYYVPSAATSQATLRAQVDLFTHISPTYFTLRDDGTLVSAEQPAMTALMRSRNVKVVPMVQNLGRYERFRAMLDTPEKMSAVVATVAGIALRPEYDGVHVDFEAIDGSDRGLLTEFMARLAALVRPSGRLVTQAVAAKTTDTRTGWGGPYDYAELGKHNDLIVVMAYDFHHAGGDPGPVAPLDWVRRAGAYAGASFGLATTVLGIPLYGYDWVTNKEPRPRARSVSHTGANELLARPGAQRGYDEGRHSEWGRYRDGDDEREVWFESARSIRAKLELMQALGLGGAAFWRLGQEDPAVWAALRSMATPTWPAPPPLGRERAYFPETRHTLQGPFLRYWQASGGLARFGYPLTEEFTEANPQDGRTYTVQYFERARFEHHPELKGTPYEVLLGHLGRWAMVANGVEPASVDAAAGAGRYFPETGLTIGHGFLAYWERNGGLMQFGLPLTGEFDERNPEDGQIYTVQYFERARFEYHPELKGTPHEVLLGHLGRQMLRERDWLP
ncbi:MAG: peptidoglycan hydrolase [Chloroflexi bacterium]|nr:peptidoglycan hydrolase [Chloroflexota bacterium]